MRRVRACASDKSGRSSTGRETEPRACDCRRSTQEQKQSARARRLRGRRRTPARPPSRPTCGRARQTPQRPPWRRVRAVSPASRHSAGQPGCHESEARTKLVAWLFAKDFAPEQLAPGGARQVFSCSGMRDCLKTDSRGVARGRGCADSASEQLTKPLAVSIVAKGAKIDEARGRGEQAPPYLDCEAYFSGFLPKVALHAELQK